MWVTSRPVEPPRHLCVNEGSLGNGYIKAMAWKHQDTLLLFATAIREN